jgi:hypothetical protein
LGWYQIVAMDPGSWLCRGWSFIQVLSVPESQEWLVIVDPSAEASFPTRRLVQQSVHGRSSDWVWATARSAPLSVAGEGAETSRRIPRGMDVPRKRWAREKRSMVGFSFEAEGKVSRA